MCTRATAFGLAVAEILSSNLAPVHSTRLITFAFENNGVRNRRAGRGQNNCRPEAFYAFLIFSIFFYAFLIFSNLSISLRFAPFPSLSILCQSFPSEAPIEMWFGLVKTQGRGRTGSCTIANSVASAQLLHLRQSQVAEKKA